MVDYHEQRLVADAMIKRGGSFVNHLGEALQRADPRNAQRIHDAFPDYWKQYLQIAKDLGLDKEED